MQKRSQSRESRAAEGKVLARDLDPYDDLRMALTQLGFERGEYSGMPIPMEGIPLVVHPAFSFASAYAKVDLEINSIPDKPEYEKWKVRNIFHCVRKRIDIIVCEKPDGRVTFRVRAAANHMSELIATLFASDAWGVDQEQAALQTLAGMVTHRQFKQYLLTGMFLEKSNRSHVTYVFRRLRPTIALAAYRPGDSGEQDASMLCALCMHPIAYYHGSWAGAMCPTDDIISHLALMRGDEHMFWRRCNQHEPGRTQAGI